jgi:hypothetical protein
MDISTIQAISFSVNTSRVLSAGPLHKVELIDVIAGQAQRNGHGMILGYAKNDPAEALTLRGCLRSLF